jgi:HK97 gp10 family phage protein
MPRRSRNAFQFRLHGLEGLDNALKQLPKSTGKSALRTELKNAAKPVEKDAESRAPRGPTGNLIESITIKTVLKKSQKRGRAKAGDVEVYVGATTPKGAHAHLIEFGTFKMAAQPFLRPAFDSNKEKVLENFSEGIWERLAKAARKLAKQAETGKLTKSARRHFGLR